MNKLFKILLLLPFILITLYAKILNPSSTYKASGSVTDLVFDKINNKLYVATTASCVDIFDLKEKKIINSIKVPQIKDFMGDLVDAKIYSIDIFNNKVLLTVQGKMGYRELYIYENNNLKKIFEIKDQLMIAKAKFITDKQILFALLGNEIILYDIDKKVNIFNTKISQSKFSDYSLNKNRDKVVVVDESGNLQILSTVNGKVLKYINGKNLDNVFAIDFKNNYILTAGQDRKSVLYDKNGKYIHSFNSSFLIYSAGLSNNYGAFSSDEDNNVTLFKISTKKILYKLSNNLMTISKILFINDNEIFIASDSNIFNYYKISN